MVVGALVVDPPDHAADWELRTLPTPGIRREDRTISLTKEKTKFRIQTKVSTKCISLLHH